MELKFWVDSPFSNLLLLPLLLFSPLKPVTGFLPAEPYEFSSWSSWQPRTWSFNVNDEAVGSIQARRSGYTGFAWSGQASVPNPREDEEDEE